MYLYSNAVKKKLASYFERKAMEEADTIVFTCPEAHNFFLRKYPFIKGKSTVLEHSYDERCYGLAERVQAKTLTMRHIGALYGDRDPSTVLRAFVRMRSTLLHDDELLFEVIGDVDEKYMKLLSAIGNNNSAVSVKTRGPVPYSESLRLMRESDVLVAIDMLCDNNIFLMSKLIDYIGSGRPIIAIAPRNGATARVIKKVGGWLVEPNDVDGMAKILGEMLEHYKNGTLQQFSPSTEMAQEYSISRNIGKFVNILNGKIKE